MNNDRLRELAGITRGVGKRPSIVLNEQMSDDVPMSAIDYIRQLPIYREVLKDAKAKPQALALAKEFVADMGDNPISPKAKQWIEDELGAIAADVNPGGAMMRDPDMSAVSDDGMDDDEVSADAGAEPEVQAAAPPPKQPRVVNPAREQARQWFYKNPTVKRADFVAKAVELGLNPNPARSFFDRLRKEVAMGRHIQDWYIIRQSKSGKILSEVSRPMMPNWIGYDEMDVGFFVATSLKEANELKNAFFLHSDEPLQVVWTSDEMDSTAKLDEYQESRPSANKGYSVGEVGHDEMTPAEMKAFRKHQKYQKIKHQYRNPARAMRAAEMEDEEDAEGDSTSPSQKVSNLRRQRDRLQRKMSGPGFNRNDELQMSRLNSELRQAENQRRHRSGQLKTTRFKLRGSSHKELWNKLDQVKEENQIPGSYADPFDFTADGSNYYITFRSYKPNDPVVAQMIEIAREYSAGASRTGREDISAT